MIEPPTWRTVFISAVPWATYLRLYRIYSPGLQGLQKSYNTEHAEGIDNYDCISGVSAPIERKPQCCTP